MCPQEEITEAQDRARRVTDFVLGLEPEQIMLVWFRFFCGLNKSDTARMLDVTPQSIAQREAKLLCMIRRNRAVEGLRVYL